VYIPRIWQVNFLPSNIDVRMVNALIPFPIFNFKNENFKQPNCRKKNSSDW